MKKTAIALFLIITCTGVHTFANRISKFRSAIGKAIGDGVLASSSKTVVGPKGEIIEVPPAGGAPKLNFTYIPKSAGASMMFSKQFNWGKITDFAPYDSSGLKDFAVRFPNIVSAYAVKRVPTDTESTVKSIETTEFFIKNSHSPETLNVVMRKQIDLENSSVVMLNAGAGPGQRNIGFRLYEGAGEEGLLGEVTIKLDMREIQKAAGAGSDRGFEVVDMTYRPSDQTVVVHFSSGHYTRVDLSDEITQLRSGTGEVVSQERSVVEHEALQPGGRWISPLPTQRSRRETFEPSAETRPSGGAL